MTALLLCAAWAADPPTSGVTLTIDAWGEVLVGHVVVDADALAVKGLKLHDEAGAPVTGPVVPLGHGMLIKGLKVGDRLVQDAIDTLMYFDANGDNYLDAADPLFAELKVFVDKNADAVVQPGEVRTLSEVGVDSISKFGSVRMKERPAK